ncbi:MAG: phospholipid carrier-dependent glycosyltransferase [Planctomycetes bacterium]|nr:phospholipid carrier-dependent glycosyltransferase [Planctomycetota bacterium]MBI3844914.1 phospholipid carrier-dependent glycosyltransferase [Planctomycetota bacterium]
MSSPNVVVRFLTPIRCLVAIAVVAAVVRLTDLRHSPPGLQQDEAANAWNSFCLLETGMDAHGDRWPVFYSYALGEDRSALFYYALLPFQAIGGLNVWTTRLPNAVGGILCVLLVYYVGRRLFGPWAGIAAAAILALNPWHLQQSRWGHESGWTTLLVVGPLALMLWANLPLDDDDSRRPRPFIALLAGLAAGIACYGYPAVRIFLPVFVLAAVAATARTWWIRIRTRAGALAIGAFVLGGAVTFGPLLWKHVTDPENISRRAAGIWTWRDSDSLPAKIGAVLARYPGHFSPRFLFLDSDAKKTSMHVDGGACHPYEMPLILIGIAVAVRRFRSSRAARLALAWLVVYPVGDLLLADPNMHLMRSFPGMCVLAVLGGVGAAAAGEWLAERRPAVCVSIALVCIAAVVWFNARFLTYFFGSYNKQPEVVAAFSSNTIEACDWIRPQLDSYDAIFISLQENTLAYIVTFVGLGYDPHRWFTEPRSSVRFEYWDVVTRSGKLHFMFDPSAQKTIDELRTNDRPDHVLFVVPPDQIRPSDRVHPVHEILGPRGHRVFLTILEGWL